MGIALINRNVGVLCDLFPAFALCTVHRNLDVAKSTSNNGTYWIFPRKLVL